MQAHTGSFVVVSVWSFVGANIYCIDSCVHVMVRASVNEHPDAEELVQPTSSLIVLDLASLPAPLSQQSAQEQVDHSLGDSASGRSRRALDGEKGDDVFAHDEEIIIRDGILFQVCVHAQEPCKCNVHIVFKEAPTCIEVEMRTVTSLAGGGEVEGAPWDRLETIILLTSALSSC